MTQTVSPSQVKAARALLKLTPAALAKSSAGSVSETTIKRFEGEGFTVSEQSAQAIREALEAAGIEFIKPDKRGGQGVRLKA